MKIIISGSTGLIGIALIDYFSEKQNNITRLVRKKSDSGDSAYWNYKSGKIELEKLENADVIIHLAGENLVGFWTNAKKDEIKYSRIKGTEFLVKSVGKLKTKPKTFICASAIGIYGNRGSERLNEESMPGDGFLAEVAKDWEAATKTLVDDNIRVINLRIGIVLARQGGALQKMLLPFKLGLGGKLGSGKQFMSWIVLDDLVSAVDYIIGNPEITGPVNIVSPGPVTNEQFTKSLGKALNRPAIMKVPSFILKSTLPEMADEMFLSSTRAYPDVLLRSGFKFRYDNLETSLKYLLN